MRRLPTLQEFRIRLSCRMPQVPSLSVQPPKGPPPRTSSRSALVSVMRCGHFVKPPTTYAVPSILRCKRLKRRWKPPRRKSNPASIRSSTVRNSTSLLQSPVSACPEISAPRHGYSFAGGFEPGRLYEFHELHRPCPGKGYPAAAQDLGGSSAGTTPNGRTVAGEDRPQSGGAGANQGGKGLGPSRAS